MFFQTFLDERERWFFWLPVLMAGGIGLYFALEKEPSAAWLWMSPLLLAALILARGQVFARSLLAAVFVFTLGFNAAQVEARIVASPLLEEKTEPLGVTGRLMRAEGLPGGGTRVMIKDPYLRGVEKKDRPRFLRIKTRTPLEALPEPGTRLSLWGPLWPPRESAAPGLNDFRRTAFFKQLGGYGVAYGKVRTAKNNFPPSFFWDGFLLIFERARQALLRMNFATLTGPEAAMTAALLTGNQTGIDNTVLDAMRASGLVHLLSISGVHVSMAALLIYAPLRFFMALWPWLALRFPIKKIAAIAAIPLTGLYVLLVGAETPTVRSALMTALVMLAIIADRKALSLRLVILASLPIMLLAPSAVMGPSFQMSFMAVLAIVTAYEKKLDSFIKEGWRLSFPLWALGAARAVRDIVLTSLLATAATTPFTVFHFQTFSFYGVISNMIALPLTSFWIMPNLLLTYLAAPFELAAPFIKAAGWGVAGIIDLAQAVASWPFAQIDMPPLPPGAFLLLVAGMLWFCLWRRAWRYAAIVPILIAFSSPLWNAPPDILISAENGLWAVRLADGTLAVQGAKKQNFTTEQWRRRAFAQSVVFLKKDSLPEIPCEKGVCTFGPAAFLSDAAAAPQVCGTKQIVIAPFDLEICAAPYVIDGRMLREKGAHAIYINDGPLRIETVKSARGLRPWSNGWNETAERQKP